ncbi:MAG: hypothetical protein LBL62_01865 [Planctomycetaceae bacterium]|nr:hypothetical protein [Planctomycetaceae bacterium]
MWNIKSFMNGRRRNKGIINYFRTLDKENQDWEILEVINYFQNNSFSVFPYDFTKKYIADHLDVFTDKECNMKYILHENKRMYFPQS